MTKEGNAASVRNLLEFYQQHQDRIFLWNDIKIYV